MSSENPSTRTRILDTAWRLLEDGAPVRMSDIAKAVGISRQALYLHFPSRAELLIAVTRHLDDVHDVDARMAATRAARRSLSPKRISLVATVSFSLIIGTAPHLSSVASVPRAFRWRLRSSVSSRVRRTCATVMPWRAKASS